MTAARLPRRAAGSAEIGLAAVEDEVNWVDRHDDGQQRRAGWPPVIRLPASTRRSEIRPEIGARTSVHSRLSSACLSAASSEPTGAGGVALRRSPCIEFPFGQRLVAHQRRRPLHVERGDLELGLGALHLRLGLLDRDPVGPRVDDEQEIALLDDLALLEMD